MASTYSDLKIELIATGEQSGTWGTTTNNNLGNDALGEAITGSADVTFASADVTLTLIDSNASQTARNLRLNLIGTTGGVTRNLILGSGCQIQKFYLIRNACADSITIKNTTGLGFTIPANHTSLIYNNGTDVGNAITYMSNLHLGTALATTFGGTGSSSTTYCSLTSNVTGILPVANGGTGLSSLGSGVATWLGTPSSANLAAAVTDETGSGSLVFGTAPTFTTSIDGGATFSAFATPTTLTMGDGAVTYTLGYAGTGLGSTTNISTAALTGAYTKTLNLGTGGTTGSTTAINIGTATTCTTTIRGGLGVGAASASTTDGEIRATNNITAYYSDERLKTKLGNIDNALAKVETLSGFYYEANEVAQALGYEVKKEVGVSAQEVQAIMPEVVAPAPIDDKYLTVRYEKLVPLLIEAIKELSEKVKELENK
jgi:hypothetical protein